MAFIEQTQELNKLLHEWRTIVRTGKPPNEILTNISDLLEGELTSYLLLDTDPFDDKRPAANDSTYTFGHLLKVLYEDEEFITKLLTSYLFNAQDDFELNCCAARQVLAMLSVFSGTEIFQDIDLHVGRCLTWVEKAKEPLRSYACGLLYMAMQMPECPSMFKERNAVVVPLVIKRLRYLTELSNDAPFVEDIPIIDKPLQIPKSASKPLKRKSERKDYDTSGCISSPSPAAIGKKRKSIYSIKKTSAYNPPHVSTFPLTVGGQQRLMLRYLHPMGEYQELLPVAFDLNVIDLIYHYINVKVQPDPQLACFALLYLSSLLCHKKFIVEFIFQGGIQRILEIPLPSSVATMSSLCLYYVAYSEDALERACLLPQSTLQCLTEYLMWLLECAHVSGRCHSSLFFSMTFSFRALLNLFDSMDGLRKVANMISTLRILRVAESDLATDDHVFLDREMAKNACLTLKKYFEAHITIIADEYKRSSARDSRNPIPTPIPAYKSMQNTAETLQSNIEYVLENDSNGLLEKQFCNRVVSLNIGPLLIQLVAIASKWKNYNNRVDVMVTALESLSALSASKKVSLTFCQQIEVSASETQSGMKILLRAVEGDLIQDIHVQKAALVCICNCVNARTIKSVKGTKIQSKREMQEMEVVKKIWSDIRLNNGIKIILTLLHTKTPITEADSVRALACKTLCGLSYDSLMCQILGKLPIFHNEELNLLMREPVLSDRMSEHEKFSKYASTLIERVTGKPFKLEYYQSIPNMSRITKADIIAHTKISYPQKELLSIIHKHLVEQGLADSASALKEEAKLTLEPPLRLGLPQLTKTTLPLSLKVNTPAKAEKILNSTPLKSVKRTAIFPSPFRNLSEQSKIASHSAPSLDGIVTEYLREQHAHCSNPVSTCPPFSLLQPHRCPEPRYRDYASPNITKRMLERQRTPFGGTQGRKYDLRYLYSRFRTAGSIKEPDDDSIYTCCAWFPFNENICLGTQTGDIKIWSVDNNEELIHSCHGAPVSTCYIAKNYKLMTTSAPFGNPLGAVWKLNCTDDGVSSIDLKLELHEDNFVQFSTGEDQVVGTEDLIAHVYDLGTGQLTRTYFDQRNANSYSKNFACFSPNDDLLLNDGCLWDVRAKKMIHKFDKFNDFVSGVFHPTALQIIINTEVWDLRTFHLLDTCPALDQCRIIFSNDNNVIYGVKHISNDTNIPIEHSGMLGPYESSFRTFDAYDFSPINTFDVKKTIFDLKPNPTDQVIAVIENGGMMSSLEMDTTCRYYEIGRMKRVGDDSDDDDDDESDDNNPNSQRGLDDVVTLFNNIFDNDEEYEIDEIDEIDEINEIDDDESWNDDDELQELIDEDDDDDDEEEENTEEQEVNSDETSDLDNESPEDLSEI